MPWEQRGGNFLDSLKRYAKTLFLSQRMVGGLKLDERAPPAIAKMNFRLQSQGLRVN